jgi:hypothetical protein
MVHKFLMFYLYVVLYPTNLFNPYVCNADQQNGVTESNKGSATGGRRSNRDGTEPPQTVPVAVTTADRSSVKDRDISNSLAAAAAAAGVTVPQQLPPANSDFESRLKEQSVEISAQDRLVMSSCNPFNRCLILCATQKRHAHRYD